uniref:MADS-box domain-containing protein n=1 Tax=Leersia perrieri TaxID=77586 RepID=A0A0D9WQP1_9ORYZ
MVRPRGRPSKGRQRIAIRHIDDVGRRQVTFSKRRHGLFKKASELATLCGAPVAVVVFSKADNVFAFGDPTASAVLRRYAPSSSPAPLSDAASDAAGAAAPEELDSLRRAAEETKAQVASEKARMRGVAEMITRAVREGREHWWDADVEALGMAELPEFARALEALRGSVQRQSNTMLAIATTTPPPLPAQQESPELNQEEGATMVRPPSKGRQKIEMRYIQDHTARQVTFTKRRQGMMKKASELATLCGAHVAVVAFSEVGNAFGFGDPCASAVLRRYAAATLTDDADAAFSAATTGELDALRRATEETKVQMASEKARMSRVAGRIKRAVKPGRKHWWDADVEALGMAELPEFVRALEKLRGSVKRQAERMPAAATTTPPPLQCNGMIRLLDDVNL